MIKIRYIFSVLLMISLACLLTGCGGIMDTHGFIANKERELFIISLCIIAIVVVPVIFLHFFITYHYRVSNKKAKYSPEWDHSVLLELLCWGIPGVAILALAILTWIYTHRLDPYQSLYHVKSKPLTVQVVALDWRWLFIYPEQHVATINFMQIPLNRDIQLLVTGDNSPMNSIEMPQLAGQIYAMPGMQTKLHFNAYKPGDYQGFSANYSGDGFADMKFTVRAGSDADFAAWIKQAQQSPNVLTADKYDQIDEPSTDGGVVFFSAPDNTLYENILMKYMMNPMPATLHDAKKQVGQDANTTH